MRTSITKLARSSVTVEDVTVIGRRKPVPDPPVDPLVVIAVALEVLAVGSVVESAVDPVIDVVVDVSEVVVNVPKDDPSDSVPLSGATSSAFPGQAAMHSDATATRSHRTTPSA
jgi:hypothetical protein